jgi:DNA-binding transcriptional LysR family regulator
MISVHFKHLETFYWAARLGSFTAAADRLHSTQSTVSMRISELELRFGVEFFDRRQRRVRLTSKGEELMAYVERMLQLTSELQERIARPDTVAGMVRIGVAEVVAETWLPAFVQALHQRYPKVTVRFEVALTLELIDKLRAGAADLILSPGRVIESGFIAHSLGTVDFRWMASPALELPPQPLSPRDLQDQRIIALPRESHHFLTIEQWFRANKAVQGPIDICNSMGVVASLTVAGLGMSLLPPLCYEKEIAAGQLAVIETTPAHDPVEFFAIKSADEFEPLTELVVDLAAEVSTFERTDRRRRRTTAESGGGEDALGRAGAIGKPEAGRSAKLV